MALKDIWVDRIDGVDDATADDVNMIAQSVIINETAITAETAERKQETQEIKNSIGEIDTALDSIIALQSNYIGGASV